MEKKFLKLSGYSLGLAMIVLFSQCVDSKPKSDLLKQIENHHQIEIEKDINRIFFINDIGCGYCIHVFSEYAKKQLEDNQTLVIINSRGNNVDLESFKEAEKGSSQVVISHKVITDNNNPLYKSGVIYLDKAVQDTVINISASELAEQIAYFELKK